MASARRSAYQVEHQCPQCGAPVTLQEADRFFECPYCRVRSIIHQKGFFRYMFRPSDRTPKDRDLIYVPYWRFKGTKVTCSLETGVQHHFMDMSRIAIPGDTYPLPPSLGLRSQALAMQLVSGDTAGAFLVPFEFKKALTIMEDQVRFLTRAGKPAVLKHYIGEVQSLVFSPFYLENGRVFDAILNEPVGTAGPAAENLENLATFRPEQETFFIPGLCPSCGWDLHGSSDSLALFCNNCDSMWRAKGKELIKINFGRAAAENKECVYMPFWRIEADVTEIPFHSYADLVRIANLPKAVIPQWEERKIAFWAPAFKINPELFIRIMRQVTVFQPSPELTGDIHGIELHPVTMHPKGGLETIKITMAILAKPLRNWLAPISESQVKPKSVSLVYLPFLKRHHDLFSEEMGISIAKNALFAGTNL